MEENYIYSKCSEREVAEEEEEEERERESENDNDSMGSGAGRTYGCSYCKRGFTNAQALGGHMNIHRKDKAKARQQQQHLSSSCLISYKSTYMETEMQEPIISAAAAAAAAAYYSSSSSSSAPQPQPQPQSQRNHHHHHQVYYPFANNNNNNNNNISPSRPCPCPCPCPRISSQPPFLLEGNHHHLPNTSTSTSTSRGRRRLFGLSSHDHEEDPLGADLSLRISSDLPLQGGNTVKHHSNTSHHNQEPVPLHLINHDIDLELRLGYHP